MFEQKMNIVGDGAQFDRSWYKDGWPTQTVLDKVARNHAWNVMKWTIDYANKSAKYEAMVNANISATHIVSYEEICKQMKWKSFEWDMNFEMMKPVEAYEEYFAEVVAADKKRRAENRRRGVEKAKATRAAKKAAKLAAEAEANNAE